MSQLKKIIKDLAARNYHINECTIDGGDIHIATDNFLFWICTGEKTVHIKEIVAKDDYLNAGGAISGMFRLKRQLDAVLDIVVAASNLLE